MGKLPVKPTAGLIYSQWWRQLLINLAFIAIVVGAVIGVGHLIWKPWLP